MLYLDMLVRACKYETRHDMPTKDKQPNLFCQGKMFYNTYTSSYPISSLAKELKNLCLNLAARKAARGQCYKTFLSVIYESSY